MLTQPFEECVQSKNLRAASAFGLLGHRPGHVVVVDDDDDDDNHGLIITVYGDSGLNHDVYTRCPRISDNCVQSHADGQHQGDDDAYSCVQSHDDGQHQGDDDACVQSHDDGQHKGDDDAYSCVQSHDDGQHKGYDDAQSHDYGQHQGDDVVDKDGNDGLYHARELNYASYDDDVHNNADIAHAFDHVAHAHNHDDIHSYVHYHDGHHAHVPNSHSGSVHHLDDHHDHVQNHNECHGHAENHNANYVHHHADQHDKHVQTHDDHQGHVRSIQEHVQHHAEEHEHMQHHIDGDDHVQHYDDNNNGNDGAIALMLDSDEFVEVDPDNRYGRYDNLIGSGAIKRVYRGFDKQEGMEVAWNQVQLHNASHVKNEIHLLDTLKHKNIIRIYKFWVDREKSKINFITELCSDTLLGFRRQHRHVCMKAVKDWAQQILRALVYLHSRNPPIIHRDLKCENIFVNCSSGKIKIGDFGSATVLDGSGHLQTLVGTPEFMAPEMFVEEYNELVDVYAFGMCMIELLTVEIPYKECDNIAQIYQKVRAGVEPNALAKIKDVDTTQFIRKCLAPASQRPSAAELLLDPFLLCDGHAQSGIRINPQVPGGPVLMKSASSPNLERARMVPLVGEPKQQEQKKKLTSHGSFVKERSHREVMVFGKIESESKLMMRLRILQPDAPAPINVNFPYDCNCDTPESVAEEMVQELDFPKTDSALIADLIASALASLMQRKLGNEDDEHEGTMGGTNSALSCQVSSYLKAVA